MRVLVADLFEQSGLDALKSLGCKVLYEPNLTDQLLPDAVRDLQADVLVVRSTQVLAGVFAAPTLKLVVRAARRLQHDRRGGGFQAWGVRRELPGAELRGSQ